ncbi:MAG: hypothetical protein HFE71_10430 [Emergencia sp.]|jgi:hypothetical protein|nr:hypothetical protein [Emergencia sp.]
MYKIQYHYTNLAKQVLFGVCFVYVLLRFLIMAEIIIFKIDGYYQATNIPLTLVMYLVIFALIVFLFRGHKYCYSTYDEKRLTYHNSLLKRSRSLDFSEAQVAVFDTKGVSFYAKDGDNFESAEPIFFLPFFRDGKIEAIQINKFYKMLKELPGMRVIKRFHVLPGYEKKWNFVTIAYGFLAVIVFMNCATPLTVCIVLLQNH